MSEQYVKIYQTTAEKKSDTEKPMVSHCVEENSVEYKVDPFNGHEYVDFGLPSGLLWAKMNVGASRETENGLIFQWGDTQGYTIEQVGSGEGKKSFTYATYKYSNDDGTVFTKYNGEDGKTTLDIEDDSARANMGGGWRMPTSGECEELASNTERISTTINGIPGYKFYKRNDSNTYIFFPANGYGYENKYYPEDGNRGSVWTSSDFNTSMVSSLSSNFHFLTTVGQPWAEIRGDGRFFGYAVRGVIEQ